MNRTEVSKLLTMAAAVDHRTLGDGDALAWHRLLRDVRLDDALEALDEHRRTSTEYLEPAHIVRGVKTLRNARLSRANLVFEPDPHAADAEDVAAWAEQRRLAADGAITPLAITAAIGEPRPMPELGGVISQMLDNIRAANHHPALQVRCPWCKAAAKTWCLKRRARASKEHVRGFLHPARLEAAGVDR